MFCLTDILSVESWILLGSIIFLGWYYVHHKWQYLKRLNIPHDPPSLLKIGNLRDVLGDRLFEIDNENKEKYGPIWGFYLGIQPNIVIHDIDILRQIFIKEFSNFPTRQVKELKMSGKELNSGLNIVRGKQWKRMRSTMTPTFSTAKLKQMNQIIDWCTDNAVTVLSRKCENGDGTFNPRDAFSRLSLDIVCSAAFSTKVHSQDDTREEPEISKMAKQLFTSSWLKPLIFLAVAFPFASKIFEKLNVSFFPRAPLRYFKMFTQHAINQKNEGPHSRVDFLQLMLNSEISDKSAKSEPEKGLTKSEIIGNSMLMILAGYDNTAKIMSSFAHSLAVHPEIQTIAQKEIDEMMETHGEFDYEGVNSLKFLDMCYNETLRLYNPILRNQRASVNEITINGFTIPAKTAVVVPTYALSHDPQYWDEPSEFRPERFRDMSQIDPIVFQPFGAGPRNCIAFRFAGMEVKMALSKLLHKFTFKRAENTPDPPLKFVFDATIRTAVNFDLRVVTREAECKSD